MVVKVSKEYSYSIALLKIIMSFANNNWGQTL